MASGIFIKPIGAWNATFHVTAHGVGDTKIFLCSQDKREFLSRYCNYLSPQVIRNSSRRRYRKLHDEVSLLAYCLMDNHFHLILHQETAEGMANLMARTQTAYVRYFNDRYRRRGPLFDARYAAQPIRDHRHAKFSIAYTHLNHEAEQRDYEFSSHRLYLGEYNCDWIDVRRGIRIYGGVDAYRAFLDRAGPAILANKLAKRGLDHDNKPDLA